MMKATSPWPGVEADRNRKLKAAAKLHGTAVRFFSFESCVECTRWFPSERAADAMAPRECPLHDDAARLSAERGKIAGKRLAGMRKAHEVQG